MFVLPKTVKWKVPGQLFYRRVHGVGAIARHGDTYFASKDNGALVLIPVGAVVLIGKRVLRVNLSQG